MPPQSALASEVLARAVLLPTEEFDLIQRLEDDHGVSTVPGLIAMLRIRPDLLASCSATLPDWLSIIHDMPAADGDGNNATARPDNTTKTSNASNATRHAPPRTRTRPRDTPAIATAVGTEIPNALTLPVLGALPTGTTWHTAWARGDDLNLHPQSGTSLGELGGMGYNVAAWRRREKDVDAHVVPEAEARFAPPHPDGTRGARADGAVIAEPVPAEVEHKPPPHIAAPMSMGIPLGMGMGMGVGTEMGGGGGMGMGMGAGLRMEELAAMAEAMSAAHSGFGGLGGRAGFAPMRRGPVVFTVPQWRATGMRT